MADKDNPNTAPFRMPDPAIVSRTMADVAERGQRIVSDFLKRQAGSAADPDPLKITIKVVADADQTPLVGASVNLRSAADEDKGTLTTDAQGLCTFSTGLESGVVYAATATHSTRSASATSVGGPTSVAWAA